MKKPEEQDRHYSREEIVSLLQAEHAFPIDRKDPILTVHTLLEVYAKVYSDIAKQHSEKIEEAEKRRFKSDLLSGCAIFVCLGSFLFMFLTKGQ